MAFRLGLIGNRLSRDLHKLRKIRNDFAHSFESRSLNEQTYQERINGIISSLDLEEKAPKMFDKPYDSDRGRFIICVILILVHLECINEQRLRLNPCKHDGVIDLTVVDPNGE